MTDFKTIKATLARVVDTGYEILLALDEQDIEVRSVKELMDKRDRQIQTLQRTVIEKSTLTTEQKDTLRNFFTRLYVLEKKINKSFSKLTLHYKNRLKDIELQKKAKKSYIAAAGTGKYFDAQISG